MIAFIDDHRAAYGVEPICRVLPIAPSTWHAHVARRVDPALSPERAKRDDVLKPAVQRVFEENYGVYGVRKVWRQLKREGHVVARCTVARLMRGLGLQGVIRGKPIRTTISDKATPYPLDHVHRHYAVPVGPRPSAVPGGTPERAVAFRLHLCGDLGRLRLRRLHHRRVRAADRRLARVTNGARELRARRAGTGSA
jgi:transposase InsO family protein